MHSIIIHNINNVPEALIFLILTNQWSHKAAKNHTDLMVNGATPSPNTATSTGTKNGTRVPYH